MSLENVVQEIDGKFARNQPHFHCHCVINFHFDQLTQDDYWWVYLRPRKMWFGKNMAKLSKTSHFILVIIIPSKVTDNQTLNEIEIYIKSLTFKLSPMLGDKNLTMIGGYTCWISDIVDFPTHPSFLNCSWRVCKEIPVWSLLSDVSTSDGLVWKSIVKPSSGFIHLSNLENN